MASTSDVAAQVRAACKKAEEARTALEQAEDSVEESHNALARALEGSSHLESDVSAMLGQFTQVKNGVKGYATTGSTGTGLEAARRAEQGEIPVERIEALRRELPPDLPPADQRLPGASRPKTDGRWIGPDGQIPPLSVAKTRCTENRKRR